MSQLKRLLDGLTKGVAWFAGLLAVLMMIHIAIDVIGRTFFNAPLVGTLEIVSAYYMAGLAFLPLALITKDRGHIIVELFTSRMKLKARTLLDAFVAILSLVYVTVFTWQAAISAIHQTAIGEAREAGTGYIAVWPSRWLVAIGFGLMAVYLLIYIIRDFQAVRTGDFDQGDLKSTSSIGHEERL
jgi:TRAP-type C4-dicarboxylate transport system permease small subunit